MPGGAGGELCLPAIAAAERTGNLPTHLLRSIAFVESGRIDPATGRAVPWPWAINVAGTGYFYDSKAAAIAAVQGFQARGIRSIDVGCAQVNLMHHATAFDSLESAFDPQTNASYAARFLNELRRATGTWPLAAAGYHSRTAEVGIAYARKVMNIWPGSARYGSLPAAAGPANAFARVRDSADYSLLTPEFAATARRIDQDRAQGPGWIQRPSEPAAVLPPGSRRTARRDLRDLPG